VNRERYDRYARTFNARDYDGVLEFWNPEFDIIVPGFVIRTGSQLKDFYVFLHSYLTERVIVQKFLAGDDQVWLEAIVRIEGTRDLDAATLAAHGLQRFFPIAKGQVIDIPQFIHYELRGGKFSKVVCAVAG
jgi:hypothetical protein